MKFISLMILMIKGINNDTKLTILIVNYKIEERHRNEQKVGNWNY